METKISRMEKEVMTAGRRRLKNIFREYSIQLISKTFLNLDNFEENHGLPKWTLKKLEI